MEIGTFKGTVYDVKWEMSGHYLCCAHAPGHVVLWMPTDQNFFIGQHHNRRSEILLHVLERGIRLEGGTSRHHNH